MDARPFTLIDENRSVEATAVVAGDRVQLSPQAVADALGWELKTEGLCRGDSCVPVGRYADRINADGIDLSALAEALDRPLALDADRGAAALGVSAGNRREQFDTLDAPDFTLSDLEGNTHSLSDYRGKKVLLVAYASW